MAMPSHDLGQPIPDTPHAVSVSLPTWKAVVGYEEGEEWVLGKMKTGYPRFFVHKSITAFADVLVEKHASPAEQAFLFPSNAVATRCLKFFRSQVPTLVTGKHVRIMDLSPVTGRIKDNGARLRPVVSAVLFPRIHYKVAKTFWQHSGDGVSSRRAEFCHKAYDEGLLLATVDESTDASIVSTLMLGKGPRRYQNCKSSSAPRQTRHHRDKDQEMVQVMASAEGKEYAQFVEERFGRNLDMSLAANAKLAIRRRIAGALTTDVELHDALKITEARALMRHVQGLSEDDVYLYPTGMSAIFNMHRIMMTFRGELKSVCYGFPYIDTLKILEKWGPGCLFYGHGSSADLDDLEKRCNTGERFLALFCEFPGNPLLKSPDLRRIRALADRFGFAVVIDETIGNFLNVHVLPFADVVVSSLTKVFSGDSNVMGGSAMLNPQGFHYQQIRKAMVEEYEDNFWAEDAIFLERNSRDFVSRIERINLNAEAICLTLRASSAVKAVYYPKFNASRPFYDHCRNPNGGYGGLLSATFHSTAEAVKFFDHLETAKGPSLGTNFTISCPYVMLAHYGELEWVAQFGVEADLVRISVGLEDSQELVSKCERALAAISTNVGPEL